MFVGGFLEKRADGGGLRLCEGIRRLARVVPVDRGTAGAHQEDQCENQQHAFGQVILSKHVSPRAYSPRWMLVQILPNLESVSRPRTELPPPVATGGLAGAPSRPARLAFFEPRSTRYRSGSWQRGEASV